jgi:hypothetical protein
METIQDQCRAQAAFGAAGYVQEWKKAGIYPYADEPATPMENVERQVFDIVALNVARHLPDFAATALKTKKFQLRMLRQVIEHSPEDLQLILAEVLNLPAGKRDELAKLLQDTSLAAIVNMAKMVSDRLKFLDGLEAILFHADSKKRLKERSELHGIIADHCWLFGDEFSLSVDDRSLTEVLRAHRRMLGDEACIDEPVGHISQSRGIVDLMLSKATRRHRANALTHLVVELKRPAVKIDARCITQIEEYAFSVAADERFRAVGVNWNFFVISDDYGPYANGRILDASGLIHRKSDMAVYVKTWAQLLDENRARLQFLQEHLESQPVKKEALRFLRERHAEYLDGIFVGKVDPGSARATSDGIGAYRLPA